MRTSHVTKNSLLAAVNRRTFRVLLGLVGCFVWLFPLLKGHALDESGLDSPARSRSKSGKSAPAVAPEESPRSASADADEEEDEDETEGASKLGPLDSQFAARTAEISLQIAWNSTTARFLAGYRERPAAGATLRRWLEKMGRYESMIARVLAEHDLPPELIYVAAVESGFEPVARSRVQAAGLWQFMAPTARSRGLKVDRWVDERLDPIRATHAACEYFEDLHRRFGSWELALAAYNVGPGVMLATIARNNSNNFWMLREIENGLPLATANYVPRILAIALADRQPQLLDLAIEREASLEGVAIAMPPQVKLSDLARALRIESSQLELQNPHLLRKRTPPDADATVYVPTALRDAAKRFAQQHRKAKPHAVIQVRLGEDLDAIARTYRRPIRLLRRINEIGRGEELWPGTQLLLPDGDEAAREAAPEMVAYVPGPPANAKGQRVFMQLSGNERLEDIAFALGVGISDLVAWNDLDPRARLFSGQFVQAWIDTKSAPSAKLIALHRSQDVTAMVRGSAAHLSDATRKRDLVRRGHVVKRGETLAKIAKRYQLSVGSLARLNAISRRAQPKAGDVLLVYTPVKKTRGTVSPPPPRAMPTSSAVRLTSASASW